MVPLDGGPQHRRGRRREPVRVRAVRSCGPRRPGRGPSPATSATSAVQYLERGARRLPAAEHADRAPPLGDTRLAGTQPDGRRHLRHRRGGSAAAVMAPGPRGPGRAGRSQSRTHLAGRPGPPAGTLVLPEEPHLDLAPGRGRPDGSVVLAAVRPSRRQTSLVGSGTGSSSIRLVTDLELP